MRRVHTPTVLQMEAVECGAASLAMVMGYYRRYVPLETLRVDTGVSRDGTKASNILKAARNYGFVGKGFNKTPESILEFRMPVIVFWNFNHFVVVEGFSRSHVYINDPASGPRCVTAEVFEQSFTGVVLVIEPGPDFKPSGSPPSARRALSRRLNGLALSLSFVGLVTICLAFPGIIIPIFSRIFVDDILIDGKAEWIQPLLLGMLVTMLFRGLVTSIQQMTLLNLNVRLSLSMSGRFLNHVLRLPLAFFSQRYAGEIANRIQINDQIAVLMSGELATSLLNLAMLFLFVGMMFFYDIPLTICVLALLMMNVIIMNGASRSRDDNMQRLSREMGTLSGITTGGLMSIETIKAGGAEDEFFGRWAGTLTRVLGGLQETLQLNSLLMIPTGLINSFTTAVILCVGGIEVMNGRLTPGMLVAFQSLAASIMAPFGELIGLIDKFQEVKTGLTRLDDVLIQPTEYARQSDSSNAALADVRSTSVNCDGAEACPLQGNLDIRDLSFGYNPLDPPFIEGFNLTLSPGKRVALVGGSGSGKSTIAKLVCGLYQPWSGEILFDGRPRNTISRFDLTGGFAFVDQDIFLFQSTIRDNLTLWDTTLSEFDVIRAARDAEIHEDIMARPGGYDSASNEGGTNFSGGQRQRLEIARALTGNPAVLVLDEATSALDPVTEKLVDDNLRRRGCTCLIVAHRLSTIRDCDEIIVLEHGKIVQRGSHDELKSQEGHYADLIKVEE
ncbi:MAG: NHLP family bacteriocin export ABC transporter peptidase/permease/ATPase subunit [Candidatus Riflebacteria bacterium]|nr:NHLP family bacteriocin export ABC transporter peptidase/permease/ATPase subunit [Candidatus Riflebacteria bacterium]